MSDGLPSRARKGSQAKLEQRLFRLRELCSAAPDEEAAGALGKALRDRANLVVAEAAKLAAGRGLDALIPDLLASLDRLFQSPARSDPRCWGKIAIVKALTALDYDQSPPFVRGAGHVQMEPVWGGQEDSASELRASSVLALVQCTDLGRRGILRMLVDAMTDRADLVRLEAVRAVEQMDGEEASLLLRLKARLRDERARVTGQAFDALLRLESEAGVAFVGGYLNSRDPEVRGEAALALGGSRLPAAVDALIRTAAETGDPEFKSVLLGALSASRRPRAIDFLVDLVRTGMSRDAKLALEALQIHETPEIRQRVEQAQKERSESVDH